MTSLMTSPLRAGIQREVEAVESEWKREMGDDDWKVYVLSKVLSNPECQFNR